MNYREYRWLIANYEADDVVFHRPRSVRVSCSNEGLRRENRLSIDLGVHGNGNFVHGRRIAGWAKLWEPGDGL